MTAIYILFQGVKFNSGERKEIQINRMHYEYKFDLLPGKIIATYKWEAGKNAAEVGAPAVTFSVSRQVLSGDFQYQQGTVSGKVATYSYFSAAKDAFTGNLSDYADSWQIKDAYQGYSNFDFNARRANPAALNDYGTKVYSYRSSSSEPGITTDRSSIADKQDAYLAPKNWWNTPFTLQTQPDEIGQAVSDLLSKIPFDIKFITGQPKDLSPSDGATLNISAPGWSETISLIRIIQASESGSRMQTRQPEAGFTTKVGSLIMGGAGNDVITGSRGWDIVDGAGGDDLIKTGNGRDILQGGLGADELWGAFGWNTYRDERDGFVDRIVIRSDQLLSNHLYGKAGNNPDGSKADVIEGLDASDQIVIQGASTAEITVQANATAYGLSGIGLYAQGYLEALYIGGDLSTAQLQAMVSGDNSQGAIDNTIFSYGNGWLP